ncbi:MAG: GNAT family N-acetyltransferase [Bacteroidales bacterium]|jgi:N-acetylglutamate synthase|nr:GNAT family N-acetyltransferase [Bacteroidales bacterium]MDD2205381.1 GNAT family N-acetyltransferase [Bacteroidales bacterium]MDD3152101.1 GNAT family N-acetyltransferase [Bacteroidales bacterium]MDD3914758.1 GNAT family N-acetyltransferase [Bacteroidales bacterium]MDD4634185.1 GNAT family N-acetyltransferase [Bacteroidales bacterium]
MTIRLLSTSDYDSIFELWGHTKGMALRNFDDSREGIAKFIQKNPDSNFIAEIGNEIVGVILCGIDGRRGYLYHASVKEEYRGQGIGTELVNKVLDVLKSKGIKKAGLLVKKDNIIGNEFWLAKGWNKRDELLYYSLNLD